MSVSLRILKSVLSVLCVILLSQCTKATDLPGPISQSSIEPLRSPYTQSAAEYLELADHETGAEKQTLYIMAAGRLIQDGQREKARAVLLRTPASRLEQNDEKQLLLAKIDEMRGQPRAALAKLSTIRAIAQRPLYYQVLYHELLAKAYQSIGNAIDSVSQRILLERLLPDEASRAENRRALWISLTSLPKAELNALAIETSDASELKGWLQLAWLSRKAYRYPHVMVNHIVRWKAEHPSHPGRFILPSPLSSVVPQLLTPPRKIALLLPITGSLAGPGRAVKDGFMAAYEASSRFESVSVRTYDTNTSNVVTVYQRAVAEGADYIVGPLSKTNVSTIAGLHHPVPTLLLNDTDTPVPFNGYTFGLSPSLEARQVAMEARQHGYRRALVIAPADAWGDEIVHAFAQQWRVHSGVIVDTLRYHSNDNMTSVMRDFLRVSDSEQREARIKHLLGGKVESTPTRRQDFDVIFLLAYPSKGRQIMPMLRYYFAGDAPVYAISTIYAGSPNPMKDRDLNGIIVCDMPWVFTHNMGNKNWPEQWNSYNRLYALGMDSYALSTQLNQLLLFPAVGVRDKSGILYLDASRRISRILAWGQFRQGSLRAL